MIAVDTSAFARYLDGMTDRAAMAASDVLDRDVAILPPVALTELLSNPNLSLSTIEFISSVPVLQVHDGYWRRAATLRADLLRRRLRAKLADCLIAQSCIDHDIPLITYDLDFRHFVQAGLKLL